MRGPLRALAKSSQRLENTLVEKGPSEKRVWKIQKNRGSVANRREPEAAEFRTTKRIIALKIEHVYN